MACAGRLWIVAGIAPQPSGTAGDAKPSKDGSFGWLRLSDIFYIFETVKKGTVKNVVVVRSQRGFSKILRNGEGPHRGFFNIDGKPVDPIWKSSHSSVVAIKGRKGEAHYFLFRGSGKVTVTVVGW